MTLLNSMVIVMSVL